MFCRFSNILVKHFFFTKICNTILDQKPPVFCGSDTRTLQLLDSSGQPAGSVITEPVSEPFFWFLSDTRIKKKKHYNYILPTLCNYKELNRHYNHFLLNL